MGRITLDEGTIVVKNGKHISANGIMVPDYAQVVLNGQQQAAVVIVKPDSNNSGISIMRGRIAKINEYEDFTVQSHANLRESEWIYSPIERSYTMDYRTLIKEDGKFYRLLTNSKAIQRLTKLMKSIRLLQKERRQPML